MNIFLSLLVICVVSVNCFTIRANTPSYIVKCSKRDTNLNQCIVKNANKAIPRLALGDSRYKIPNMLPLKLEEVVLRNDKDLKFTMRNIEVYGLEKTIMKNANMDFAYNKLEYNLTNPRVTIFGDYKIDGYMLDEPIYGGGKANITIVNGRFSHGIGFARTDNKILYSNLKYKPQLVIYNLHNLYRGNEFHGYQTNVFLNNNWQEVTKSLQRGAGKAMNDLLLQLYKTLSIVMPVNEIFLP